MKRILLDSGEYRQELRLVGSEGSQVGYGGPPARYCTGFIEKHGRNARGGFERLAFAYEDAELGPPADADGDRRGGGEAECAGAGNDQD